MLLLLVDVVALAGQGLPLVAVPWGSDGPVTEVRATGMSGQDQATAHRTCPSAS
jgi:hypothetical protein